MLVRPTGMVRRIHRESEPTVTTDAPCTTPATGNAVATSDLRPNVNPDRAVVNTSTSPTRDVSIEYEFARGWEAAGY